MQLSALYVLQAITVQLAPVPRPHVQQGHGAQPVVQALNQEAVATAQQGPGAQPLGPP